RSCGAVISSGTCISAKFGDGARSISSQRGSSEQTPPLGVRSRIRLRDAFKRAATLRQKTRRVCRGRRAVGPSSRGARVNPCKKTERNRSDDHDANGRRGDVGNEAGQREAERDTGVEIQPEQAVLDLHRNV